MYGRFQLHTSMSCTTRILWTILHVGISNSNKLDCTDRTLWICLNRIWLFRTIFESQWKYKQNHTYPWQLLSSPWLTLVITCQALLGSTQGNMCTEQIQLCMFCTWFREKTLQWDIWHYNSSNFHHLKWWKSFIYLKVPKTTL